MSNKITSSNKLSIWLNNEDIELTSNFCGLTLSSKVAQGKEKVDWVLKKNSKIITVISGLPIEKSELFAKDNQDGLVGALKNLKIIENFNDALAHDFLSYTLSVNDVASAFCILAQGHNLKYDENFVGKIQNPNPVLQCFSVVGATKEVSNKELSIENKASGAKLKGMVHMRFSKRSEDEMRSWLHLLQQFDVPLDQVMPPNVDYFNIGENFGALQGCAWEDNSMMKVALEFGADFCLPLSHMLNTWDGWDMYGNGANKLILFLANSTTEQGTEQLNRACKEFGRKNNKTIRAIEDLFALSLFKNSDVKSVSKLIQASPFLDKMFLFDEGLCNWLTHGRFELCKGESGVKLFEKKIQEFVTLKEGADFPKFFMEKSLIKACFRMNGANEKAFKDLKLLPKLSGIDGKATDSFFKKMAKESSLTKEFGAFEVKFLKLIGVSSKTLISCADRFSQEGLIALQEDFAEQEKEHLSSELPLSALKVKLNKKRINDGESIKEINGVKAKHL